MMKINKAQHIYEVGCGIGKMIPYMLSIKPEDCTYAACDVSEKMIECARSYLSNYMKKMGVTESFDKVMERQHLELGVHDGEIPFKASYKFDRIILNSVLQITPDPKKMMQSLREVAA
jgi:ubiquinone/menaquinone biosynthesis C-methylase UbiE